MIINNDNIAVFTSKQILEGDPIMRVYCNKDDFTLEFYPDKDFNQEDLRVISLRQAFSLDSSLEDLVVRLSLGECAYRESFGSPWIISSH